MDIKPESEIVSGLKVFFQTISSGSWMVFRGFLEASGGQEEIT